MPLSSEARGVAMIVRGIIYRHVAANDPPPIFKPPPPD